MNCETERETADQRGDITSHGSTEETTSEDSSDSEHNGLPDKGKDERWRKQEDNNRDELAWEHVLTALHEGPNVGVQPPPRAVGWNNGLELGGA